MSDITVDPRDAFEKVFPPPKHVIRCGKGYACTEYNAWGAHNFIRQWEGWSAAMLQGANSNSPVIPDGWVACSKRMPSVGEQVLAYRPYAPESNDPLIKMAIYVGGSAHGHGFDCYCKPTHWMPLPAAPQQEAKP